MASLSNRLNTLLLLVLIVMVGAVIAMFAARAYGGPLDPPGPVASTDGVREPGTPISSLPFAITQPGYYYVTRDLTGGTGQDGITISTSNVTIDLGGFRLLGGASPGKGIVASGPRNIVIRNGSVRAWTTGIDLQATYSRIEDVQALSNTIGISSGGLTVVEDCIAALNSSRGIQGLSAIVVRNCTVAENGAGVLLESYSLMERTRVYNHPGTGVFVNGHFTTIRDNDISKNSNYDIDLPPGRIGNVVMNNVYCVLTDEGTNTIVMGNAVRVEDCL